VSANYLFISKADLVQFAAKKLYKGGKSGYAVVKVMLSVHKFNKMEVCENTSRLVFAPRFMLRGQFFQAFNDDVMRLNWFACAECEHNINKGRSFSNK
jgi:5-methylthioribose kinase